MLIWDALRRPELDKLVRPGKRRYSVAVATNLKQARLIVAAAHSLVERRPILRPLIASVSDDEIVFTNGACITAFPCTSRGGWGWPISCLVMDEAAHFLDTEGNSAAEQVWRALVPSTAQFGEHGRIIVSSTPYGSDGLFASLWAQAESGELRDAVALGRRRRRRIRPSRRTFLAAEEQRDPESFRSEYEAAFAGGGACFLDPERIADAVVDRAELAPEQAVAWVAGLDPAFSSDPFGLALVGRDPVDPARLVLGLARAWRPARRKPAGFEERREHEDAVLAEVAELCLRYGARVVTDQYATAPIVDYLRRRGLSVRTHAMSAASKSAVFASLRARLNSGSLDVYDHVDLLAELRRLRTKSCSPTRLGGSACAVAGAARRRALAARAQRRRRLLRRTSKRP